MDEVPAPVRILSAVLLFILAGTHGLSAVDQWSTEPLVGLGHALVLALFGLPLLFVAVLPRQAGPVLHQRLGVRPDEASDVTGLLIHVVFAYLVFGLTIISTADALTDFLASGRHPAEGIRVEAEVIIQGLLLNLALFAAAAVSWLMLVEGDRGHQVVMELGLVPKEPLKSVVYGVATALAVILGMAVLSVILDLLGLAPSNPQARAIAGALSPLTALVVATLAAVGEELYFRGFLLPRTNNLTQAALFGVIHATYLTALQVILPFLLGLVFGWLRRKATLWAPIVAHGTFNALVLLATIYATDKVAIASWLLP